MGGKRRNAWKGAAAGLVAGIVASASMNLFLWNAFGSRRQTGGASPPEEGEDPTVRRQVRARL